MTTSTERNNHPHPAGHLDREDPYGTGPRCAKSPDAGWTADHTRPPGIEPGPEPKPASRSLPWKGLPKSGDAGVNPVGDDGSPPRRPPPQRMMACGLSAASMVIMAAGGPNRTGGGGVLQVADIIGGAVTRTATLSAHNAASPPGRRDAQRESIGAAGGAATWV